MFKLPYDIQDLILSYSNPFIEYYKKEYKKSLLYIKNLDNILKPQYYNFITLYEEHNYDHFLKDNYHRYYLCKCNKGKKMYGECGYFDIFDGSYNCYLNYLRNKSRKRDYLYTQDKPINLRIKKHLKTKHHKEWSQKNITK